MLGEGQVTPWTRHHSNAKLSQRQTLIHTHEQCKVILILMSLKYGKKPTYAWGEHTGSAQEGHRSDTRFKPSEVTVLTTVSYS